MTPPRLNADVIGARLQQIRVMLRDLEGVGAVDAERLEAEPVTRAAVERFVQAIVDLAIDVNSHIEVAELGEAPATGRQSFEYLVRCEAIDADLADRIAGAAGLRNVLVHRYVDIDVAKVAEAVPEVLDGFGSYVRQIAAFLLRRTE